MRLLLLGRSGIEHRTLRCCDFHSVFFVPSTLRVSGVASLALGGHSAVDRDLGVIVVLERLGCCYEILFCLVSVM